MRSRTRSAFPCFVKPARLGSSVGITKAHDEAELDDAVELAFRHDDKVLVEEFLDGIEVEVGVLGNREPDRVDSRARSCRSGTSGTTSSRSTTKAAWSS